MKDNVIGELINSIKEAPEETQNTYSAVVSKVDSEGVVWVNLAGSTKETPTVSTSAEVKSGDAVNVEWRNNKLYIAGNYSNPSAGTERVIRVEAVAKDAEDTANNAESAAQSAQDSAQQAHQIAANTEQHFWFTETGEDTGAHITEVTQEEWNDSEGEKYHSGGNLLARSNGIAVRDGLEEIATFGVDGAVIGKNGEAQTIIDNDEITMLTDEGVEVFKASTGTGTSTQTVTKSINQSITIKVGSPVSKTYTTLANVASGDTFDIKLSASSNTFTFTFTKETIETKSKTIGTTTLYADYNGTTGFTFRIFSSFSGASLNVTVVNIKYQKEVTNARVDIGGRLYLEGHSSFVGAWDGGSVQRSSNLPTGTTYQDMGVSLSLTTGIFIVVAKVQFGSNATGRRAVRLTVDGTEMGHTAVNNGAVSGAVTNLQTVGIIAVTDTSSTVKVQAFQNSGSSLACTTIYRYVRIR